MSLDQMAAAVDRLSAAQSSTSSPESRAALNLLKEQLMLLRGSQDVCELVERTAEPFLCVRTAGGASTVDWATTEQYFAALNHMASEGASFAGRCAALEHFARFAVLNVTMQDGASHWLWRG